ncbi:hypothetical protein, partial [Thiolapillus sp.]|uniref:hypothetical protein n=1 Tax=Thiolapillus sp. TaxID=2017437 RepID=UPI0025FE487D
MSVIVEFPVSPAAPTFRGHCDGRADGLNPRGGGSLPSPRFVPTKKLAFLKVRANWYHFHC